MYSTHVNNQRNNRTDIIIQNSEDEKNMIRLTETGTIRDVTLCFSRDGRFLFLGEKGCLRIGYQYDGDKKSTATENDKPVEQPTKKKWRLFGR
mgnify:FL=1